MEEKNIRYYVTGLCYNENQYCMDGCFEYGDYDTEEEAMARLHEIHEDVIANKDSYFKLCDEKAEYLYITLEKCVVNETEINCIDIVNEFIVPRH